MTLPTAAKAELLQCQTPLPCRRTTSAWTISVRRFCNQTMTMTNIYHPHKKYGLVVLMVNFVMKTEEKVAMATISFMCW